MDVVIKIVMVLELTVAAIVCLSPFEDRRDRIMYLIYLFSGSMVLNFILYYFMKNFLH